MDSTYKDIAEPYPEKTRQPSPHKRNGRTDDGRGACNRGKVVSEEDIPVGRYEVNSIIETFRRGLLFSCPDDPLFKMPTIEFIGKQIESQTDE